MDLNNNIKSIILDYYQYSDKAMIKFKELWKGKISKVNRLFHVNISDYYQDCYVCSVPDHYNRECIKFYHNVHIINSTILK